MPDDARRDARPRTLLALAALAALYALSLSGILFDPLALPSRDNLVFHMPRFIYIAGSIEHGQGLPLWYKSMGGTPIGADSVSMFPFAPYKFIGYLIYQLPGIDAASAYKWMLALGMLVTAWGWWLFLYKWTGSRGAALIGALILLMGGCGITVYHQEQILVTIMLAPWTLLALRASLKDVRYLPVAGVLVGTASTIHYPHIHMLTLIFLGLSYAFTHWPGRAALVGGMGAVGRRPMILATTCLGFLAASLPALYTARTMGGFASPLRGQTELAVDTMGKYLAMQHPEFSLGPLALASYIYPFRPVGSDWLLPYATLTGLVLAVCGALMNFRRARMALIMFALTLWAALGVYTFVPHALYALHVPFIRLFRQWYHFTPFLNLCVSALGALGASWLMEVADRRLGGRVRWAPAGLLMALAALIAAEGRIFARHYEAGRLIAVERPLARPSERQYEALLTHEVNFAYSLYRNMMGEGFLAAYESHPEADSSPRLGTDLMQYKPWYRYYKACKEIMLFYPTFTREYFTYAPVPEGQEAELLETFCRGGPPEGAVLVKAPPGMPRSEFETAMGQGPGGPDTISHMRLTEGLDIGTRGVNLSAEIPSRGLLVFPYAYGLDLEVEVGGIPAATYPVMEGAFTGVIADPGRVELSMRPGRDAFYALQGLQLAALALAALASIAIRKGAS